MEPLYISVHPPLFMIKNYQNLPCGFCSYDNTSVMREATNLNGAARLILVSILSMLLCRLVTLRIVIIALSETGTAGIKARDQYVHCENVYSIFSDAIKLKKGKTRHI